MRSTPQSHLLAFSLLGLFSKVYAQLCPTPCACPWPSPRCPLGVPLVLDGCGCCQVCARRLGEPCDHLHVCNPSQGLVCQPGAGPGGRGAVCLLGEDDGSCEVNGRLYRDGETFQPHCRIRCRCEDGGFTCVPLCSEDVRLPSWDCPHPRRVEVPGKCCPEWVCDQAGAPGVQPLPARGASGTSPSCANQKCLQALPSVPWGAKSPHLRAPDTKNQKEGQQNMTRDPRCPASSLRRPLVSLAQNGARPGAPARPPAGQVWPPACPTRTASAAWRPSTAGAWRGPALPPGAAAPGTEPFRAGLGMESWYPVGVPVPKPGADGPTLGAGNDQLGSTIHTLEDENIRKLPGPSGPGSIAQAA
ncbi:CCN family member 5 isoform X1 [Choloepus didactylus]|uniref:CCN family member 5 isoform X1 n=1 Tax=Choloepus didactylus TaxID=27675 RepID=UPI00189FAF9B|nr:CCN family member 5 isoform X1 [Choloepus didactylus]